MCTRMRLSSGSGRESGSSCRSLEHHRPDEFDALTANGISRLRLHTFTIETHLPFSVSASVDVAPMAIIGTLLPITAANGNVRPRRERSFVERRKPSLHCPRLRTFLNGNNQVTLGIG